MAAGPSRAMPPYDDTLKALAGRPIPSRLRFAIGLFVVDDNAVVTVHSPGWRAIQRWFVWSPGHGVVRPRRLAAGRPADLVVAAGAGDGTTRRRVLDLLVDGGGDAEYLLGELMALLALPGSDLLLEGGRGPAASVGSALVEPGEKHLAMFERVIDERSRQWASTEED